MTVAILNQKKMLWARMSIISNSVLIFIKLIIWQLSGSISILSESIHSAIDLFAALIAFYAIRQASKPADEGHPYGHGKYENLSGIIESALIIVAGALICSEAFPKLFNPHKIELIDSAIGVMLLSALVNIFVSRKLHQIAKETNSIALETDGAHLAVDVYTCLGVMGGLIAIRLTGITIIDPIISILIAIYIFYIGIHLSIKSAKDLLDAGLPGSSILEIEEILAEHVPHIYAYRNIATRKSGSTIMIDLTLQFHAHQPVKEAHDMAHHIQEHLESHFKDSRVSIHLEPCNENCAECRIKSCSANANHIQSLEP